MTQDEIDEEFERLRRRIDEAKKARAEAEGDVVRAEAKHRETLAVRKRARSHLAHAKYLYERTEADCLARSKLLCELLNEGQVKEDESA